MLTGLFFQDAYCRPCRFTTGEMVPMECSKSAVGTLNYCHFQYYVYLGLVVECWSTVGTCEYHHHTQLSFALSESLVAIKCFHLHFSSTWSIAESKLTPLLEIQL